jgi:transcriptional regulator with XRE-family HTH domain
MSLGKTIKIARIHKGMKQKDLVAATGLSSGRISAIESDTLDPPFSAMQTIATILGLSLDALPPATHPSRISDRGPWTAKARAKRARAGKG